MNPYKTNRSKDEPKSIFNMKRISPKSTVPNQNCSLIHSSYHCDMLITGDRHCSTNEFFFKFYAKFEICLTFFWSRIATTCELAI